MKIKQILSSLLAATMLLGSVTANAVTIESDDTPKRSGAAVEQESSGVSVTSNKTQHGLPADLQDGAILHAWCWSCNTIKANMKDIADAGYTAIQTSPMQQSYSRYSSYNVLMGDDVTNGTQGAWWWQYQPTAQKLGNYQFFTDPSNDTKCEQEYAAMCSEAEKYGISIITDIVSNHTTSHYVLHEVVDETTGETVLAEKPDGQIDILPEMSTAVGGYNNLWHTNAFVDKDDSSVSNVAYRTRLIDYKNGGLPDVNTENEAYQAYVVKYLNKLIELGCDGFRFDTAHRIGVSTIDGSSYNYWDAVTGVNAVNDYKGTLVKLGKFTDSTVSPNDLFIYGEMLKSEYASGYTDKIRITDYNYGQKVRAAVTANSISTSSVMQNSTTMHTVNGVSCNNITWVESHDDYCNVNPNTNKHDTEDLTEEQIRLSWAIITARKAGTPLYFNRPAGSDALVDNFWGDNIAGAKGNDSFRDPEVAAVNKFRNAMAISGADDEYLRNIAGNTKVLQIDRFDSNDIDQGKCGTVIVNLSDYDKDIDTPTSMAVGKYYDAVSGNVFEVYNNNGTNYIKGHIYSRKAAVIYMTASQYDDAYNMGDTYSLSDKNYVYFYNSFGKSDIEVSLSGKSPQPMIWSDALHCYFYEYTAESVDSVVFSTSGDNGSTFTYTATDGFQPGKLYVPTGTASGEWKALSDIKTGRVYFNDQNRSWSSYEVKAYLIGDSDRKNAAYPGEGMTLLGNGVCGFTGDLYSYIYYYVDGKEYRQIKFVAGDGSSDRTSTVSIGGKDLWTITAGGTSVSPSSSTMNIAVNKPITIDYHYYDRAVGDPSTGTERSKEFSYTATTSDLSSVVTSGIGQLGLESVYDNNVYFGTQLKYVLGIASYYDADSSRNAGMTYGGRINPRFISHKTSSFGGRFGDNVGNLSISGENWVTYKDENGSAISPDDVLPDLSNVSTVVVWGFSEPKTYTLTLNYPKTNTAPTVTVAGDLKTSNAYGGVSTYKCSFDQLPTAENNVFAPGMTTPDGYVFDGWYQIEFSGNTAAKYVKVTSNPNYNFRVTKDMTLYAVYAPASNHNTDKSASVTANSIDHFIDDNGNLSYHYNTMLNIFNCEDNDSKITDIGIVYVNLSDNNDVNYESVKSSVTGVVGNGTSSGDHYHYYQYSVTNAEAALTNKNRIQFTFTLNESQISGAYSNVAAFAVYKYAGQNAWVVSENCVQYRYSGGSVTVTEMNR